MQCKGRLCGPWNAFAIAIYTRLIKHDSDTCLPQCNARLLTGLRVFTAVMFA